MKNVCDFQTAVLYYTCRSVTRNTRIFVAHWYNIWGLEYTSSEINIIIIIAIFC